MRAQRDKRELIGRNRRIFEMRQGGTSLLEIAALFKISRVRVHQIVIREGQRQRQSGTTANISIALT